MLAAALCLGLAEQDPPSSDQLADHALIREDAIRKRREGPRAGQHQEEEEEEDAVPRPTKTANVGSSSKKPSRITTPLPQLLLKTTGAPNRCWQPDPSACRLAAVLCHAFYHICRSPKFPGIPLGGSVPHLQDGTSSPITGIVPTKHKTPREAKVEFPFESEREVFAIVLAAVLHSTKVLGIFCKVKYMINTFWPLVGIDHPIALEMAGGLEGAGPVVPSDGGDYPPPSTTLFTEQIFAFEMMISQIVVRNTLLSGAASRTTPAQLVVLPEHVVSNILDGLAALLPVSKDDEEGGDAASLVSSGAEMVPIDQMTQLIIKSVYLEPHLILAGSTEIALGAVIVACCCNLVPWTNDAWSLVLSRCQGEKRKEGDRDSYINYALLREVLVGCRQIAATLFGGAEQAFKKNFVSADFLRTKISLQNVGVASPVAEGWKIRF